MSKQMNISPVKSNLLYFSKDFQVVSLINGENDFQIDISNLGIKGNAKTDEAISKFGKPLRYPKLPKSTELILGNIDVTYKQKPIILISDKIDAKFSTFEMITEESNVVSKIDIISRDETEFMNRLIFFDAAINAAITMKLAQVALNIPNVKTDADFVKEFKKITGNSNVEIEKYFEMIHEQNIAPVPCKFDTENETDYAFTQDDMKTSKDFNHAICSCMTNYLKKCDSNSLSAQGKIIKHFFTKPKFAQKGTNVLPQSATKKHYVVQKDGVVQKEAFNYAWNVKIQRACKKNPKRDYFATRTHRKKPFELEDFHLKQFVNRDGEVVGGCYSPFFDMQIVAKPEIELKLGTTWASTKMSWFVTEISLKEKQRNTNNGLTGFLDNDDEEEEVMSGFLDGGDNLSDDAGEY